MAIPCDDLSIPNQNVNKMNEPEVLRVQGARTGFKINVRKTKSLNLGISEDEKVTFVTLTFFVPVLLKM